MIDRRTAASCNRDQDVDALEQMLALVQLNDSLCVTLGLDKDTVPDHVIDFDKDEPTGSADIDQEEIARDVLTESGMIMQREDNDDNDPVMQPVARSTAIEYINSLRKYLSTISVPHQGRLDGDLATTQQQLMKAERMHRMERLQQPTIQSFFSHSPQDNQNDN